MKDFNIAKYLRENHLGSHAILGAYVDLHGLKEEEEMQSGNNSEIITLSYNDYPSIDDDDQMFAIETFIEFVKSLGGNAEVVKDAFDNIDFKLIGISSEKVKAAYKELIDAESDKDFSDEGPFNYLTSWTVNDSGDQIEEQEMELDTEIPYEGPEHKLDGFGDEFKQDKPVEEAGKDDKEDSTVQELEKPERIYSDEWMNDSVDGKRVGSWTCYYEDHLGVLYWVHDDIPGEHVTVYATPNWDGAKGTAIEVQLNSGEQGTDYATIGEPSYPDFESYAKDMIPVLKKVEAKYKAGKYNDYIDYEDSMDTDDSVNPFPSIMKEKEDNSMTGDKGWQYDDDEDDYDRFADLGGDQIKSAIKSLMDDGFDSREIAQFVVDTIKSFKSFKEEVTVSSSGVEMEEAKGQFQSFDWNTIDQQGNLARLVVDTGTNDAGEEVIRVGHPNTGGTLAMFTKDDIRNNDGYLRVGGRNFQVQPSLINWANS